MKKGFALVLMLCMVFVLAACGSDNDAMDTPATDEYNVPDDFKIPLGTTGAKVDIPYEVGFETYESEVNDFFGGGPSGEWRIIVNTELKSDFTGYTMDEYANLYAQANGAEGATKVADGNYWFTYSNAAGEDEVYKFYSVVREGAEKYYHISFYCFEDMWEHYGNKFAEWAPTIEVE